MNLTVSGVEAAYFDLDVLFIQCGIDTAVAAHGEGLARMHPAVQRDGGLFARGNRVDGKARPGVDVAADENVGLGCLVGQTVRLGGSLFGGLQGADIQLAPVDSLSDGTDNRVNFQGLELPGSDWFAAALLIRFAEFHNFNFEPGDFALFAEDFDRRIQEAEPDTFVHSLLELFGISRHLCLAAAVNDNCLCSKTDRRTADVHGDVARADDRTALPDLRLLAEVHFTQEVHTAEYALQVFAGDTERRGLLRADGQVEALEALVAELLDGLILADLHAALKVDAHLLDDVDFGIQNILLQTEVGDAECQHTSGNRVPVKNGDVFIALLSKIVSAA